LKEQLISVATGNPPLGLCQETLMGMGMGMVFGAFSGFKSIPSFVVELSSTTKEGTYGKAD